MKTIISAAALALVALADPYIDPSYTGWKNGGGKCGLQVEVIFDFVSKDCMEAFPAFSDVRRCWGVEGAGPFSCPS